MKTPAHSSFGNRHSAFLPLFLSLIGLTLFASSSFAQNVTVLNSTGADGSYATLKLAFDAINANGTQSGNLITVTIIADTIETASAVLNQPSVSSWTSLTITPSGARTISGNLAAPLIDLNGADGVTIDGLNASGNSLIISNTSTSGLTNTSTIRFINDATNNTVKNCTIQGSSTAVTLGTIFFSTGTASGNDGNIITANTITSAGANLPTNAIYSRRPQQTTAALQF